MRVKPQPREMTAQDWKALYLVMRLQEQVVLHGAIALENFIAAAAPLAAPEESSR